MVTIYVDADACPVKDEVIRVAERHSVPVTFVSNSGYRTGNHPLLRSVMVDATPDAADIWITEAIGTGDICITADIPLAARCVEKDAFVLGPTGKVLDKDAIGMALAVRDLMTDLRSSGEITGGPRSFAKQDRSRFLNALEVALQAAKRL